MTHVSEPGTWDDDFPHPEPVMDVTENRVVATLLGPKGKPIRQWRERPPFGFQRPSTNHRRPR